MMKLFNFGKFPAGKPKIILEIGNLSCSRTLANQEQKCVHFLCLRNVTHIF